MNTMKNKCKQWTVEAVKLISGMKAASPVKHYQHKAAGMSSEKIKPCVRNEVTD